MKLTKAEIQTIKTYDSKSSDWVLKHETPNFWGSQMDKFYKLLPKGKILEIGSGGGRDAKELIGKGYDYVGTDACMSNLMRPAMYGAYHHITVLGKEKNKSKKTYDVTGSLCENNDKFAIDRQLPEIEVGDFIVIHDTGAHGHAMGFNYNGKLKSAELLLREDGSIIQIRRAETVKDYFATLDFDSLKEFK